MTRFTARTRDELETRIWAHCQARSWQRRAWCAVGKTATGWVADLEMMG